LNDDIFAQWIWRQVVATAYKSYNFFRISFKSGERPGRIFLKYLKMFDVPCQGFAQNIVLKGSYIAPAQLPGMRKKYNIL